MTKRKSQRRQRKPTRQNRSRSWPYLLLGILGLVAVVAGMSITGSRLPPPSPAPPVQTPPRTDTSRQADQVSYPEVPRISLAEAKARYDAGTALFVDVRAQEEYDTAHIPNAISLPLADLEARYQELPQDAEIITY
ncbi:MAG: rhodanese-like domain-containing protein [Anaerolineae bacterium]